MKVRRQLLAVLVTLLAAGCVGDPRPAPTADRFPATAGALSAPTTPMVRQELRSHADFDTLEESLLRRMGVPELIAVYQKLAEGAEPATEPDAVLLLQRLALLHLRLGSRDGGFQEAFRVADQLRQKAPQSPHTQYLMGAITSLLMPPRTDGSYRIDPRRKDVAQRLSQHWEQLLRLDADYIGPSGRRAERIREDLALLKVAIAATATASDAAGGPEILAVPDVAQEPALQGLGERSDRPEGDAGKRAGSVALATADEATAQQDLHRLDSGNTMARRLLCRDRLERSIDPAAVTRDVVRWVELRCAIELDEPDRALTWLAGLVVSGAAADPCRWQARISGGTTSNREAVARAMSARGLAGCPR